MLVADALDVVLAKAVAQQGRAFAGLDRDDASAMFLLQVIARRQASRPTPTRRQKPASRNPGCVAWTASNTCASAGPVQA